MNSKMFVGVFSSLFLLPIFHATAAPLFYVSHIDSFTLYAVSNNDVDSVNFEDISGQVQQTSLSYSDHADADGLLVSGNNSYPQHAEGSITESAQIGSLHALVTAESDSNGQPYGNFDNANVRADIESVTTWSDTVFLFSSTPGGSDFTATLYLDDFVTNSVGSQPGVSYSIGSSVRTTLNINGIFGLTPLGILDNEYVQSGQAISSNPPIPNETSVTFHVQGAMTLTFTGTLDVRSTGLGGDNRTVADASDTAGVLLTSSDPNASYTTASGIMFAPEPASLGVLTVGLIAANLRRRR